MLRPSTKAQDEVPSEVEGLRRPNGLLAMTGDGMNKFLIINPFGIGDALFTTPVIKTLKDKHPDCFIGYWCNERVGDLLKNNTKIDKVFALSRGDIKRIYRSPLSRITVLFKLIREIRRERFDIAFDFSLDSRYGLWSKFAGIKKRIGLDYKNRGRFLTDKVKLAGYSGKHVVKYYLDLINFMDPHYRVSSSVPYSLEVSAEDRIKARGILKECGVTATDLLIGVIPGGGASWGRDAIYKQWSAEKFAELTDRLIKDLNVKVVLLGSIDEKSIADIVEKIVLSCPRKRASIDSRFRGNDGRGIPAGVYPRESGGGNDNEIALAASRPRNDDDRLINLTGKLNLKELAAAISELKLLICNDGGPLHMAVALGIKTVSIFGPVDEIVYGPYPSDAKHVVVKKNLPCRPCYKDFRFARCSNNRKCLEDITVGEVYEQVRGLLSNNGL